MSDYTSIHPVETVKGWSVVTVRKFLNFKKDYFSLNDVEISKFEENGINGRALLGYTEEKLLRDGLRSGPAINIAKYVAQLNSQKQPVATTVATARSPSNSVFIFIDNSNIFIEGSKFVSQLENVNAFDHKQSNFLDFNVDHGLLVTTVLRGRKLSSISVFGSRPPPNDTLWKLAMDHGYEVIVYEQNLLNKWRNVIKLVCSAMRTLLTKNPGTFLLVADDGDYCPLVKEAREENWKVETWFWSESGLNDVLSFVPLDNYYKSFTYITGPDFTNDKYSLEISGNIIKSWTWRNETLMECFCALRLFGRWHWENENFAFLYFENKKQLDSAKAWFERNYPGIWLRVVTKVTRRNSL